MWRRGRALNQAVGRCIRHKGDYGAIMLLDARFCQTANQLCLPRWYAESTTAYDCSLRDAQVHYTIPYKYALHNVQAQYTRQEHFTQISTALYHASALPVFCFIDDAIDNQTSRSGYTWGYGFFAYRGCLLKEHATWTLLS